MNTERLSRLRPWLVPCIPAICAGAVLGLAIWGAPAIANDRYFQATRKDCSSCHVNVSGNYQQLTRYGAAFFRNRCPGVRGGC